MFYPEYYFNFDAMDVPGFIISDTHYWHKNIIDYEKRPFRDTAGLPDVEAMNAAMIAAHNKVVTTPNAIVLHGGDLFMNRKDEKKYRVEDSKRQREVINQLNGALAVAKGNHDELEDFKYLPEVLVADQIYFTYHGVTYWLAHAPLDPRADIPTGGVPTRLERPKAARNYDVALCGHVHSQWLSIPKTGSGPRVLNVGADLCAYTPRTLDELEALCKSEDLIK